MGILKHGLTSEKNIKTWLDSLASRGILLAPRKMDDSLLFRHVENSEQISFLPGRTVLPIKDVFFPPTEQLFTIQKTGKEIFLRETLPEGMTVIYGVRPCDGRGVRILDALFLDTPPIDPYYAIRRKNSVLIGEACRELGSSCFCTSVGGAPDDSADMDVMIYSNDDACIVEVITEKGGAITSSLQMVDEDHPIIKTIHSNPLFSSPQTIAWTEKFTDEYWQKASERCLGCRACAYVCPTCRCFTVRDERIESGRFERLRCWDSCAGMNYRSVAGGKKGRVEKAERLRNRVYCKFYYYLEQTRLELPSACTGCGRCIDVCPAGVDITEVLVHLGKME